MSVINFETAIGDRIVIERVTIVKSDSHPPGAVVFSVESHSKDGFEDVEFFSTHAEARAAEKGSVVTRKQFNELTPRQAADYMRSGGRVAD